MSFSILWLEIVIGVSEGFILVVTLQCLETQGEHMTLKYMLTIRTVSVGISTEKTWTTWNSNWVFSSAVWNAR